MAKETQKAKIDRLEQEVEELKTKNQQYLNDLTDLHNQLSQEASAITENELYLRVVQERDSYFKLVQSDSKSREELKQRYKETIQKLTNENEQLRNEIAIKNSNSESIIQKLKSEKKHNDRGAGRKAKFTDQQIKDIIRDRKSMTIVQLAQKYNCSTGLIHKLINEK